MALQQNVSLPDSIRILPNGKKFNKCSKDLMTRKFVISTLCRRMYDVTKTIHLTIDKSHMAANPKIQLLPFEAVLVKNSGTLIWQLCTSFILSTCKFIERLKLFSSEKLSQCCKVLAEPFYCRTMPQFASRPSDASPPLRRSRKGGETSPWPKRPFTLSRLFKTFSEESSSLHRLSLIRMSWMRSRGILCKCWSTQRRSSWLRKITLLKTMRWKWSLRIQFRYKCQFFHKVGPIS